MPTAAATRLMLRGCLWAEFSAAQDAAPGHILLRVLESQSRVAGANTVEKHSLSQNE